MGLLDTLTGAFSPRLALRRAVRLGDRGRIGPSFRLMSRAARAGLAEAEYRIGRCYLEGGGVPVSRADAVRWLGKAGEQGYVEAQSLLATLYLHGLVATARGHGAAANLFDSNESAASPDYQEAARWARKAAEGGSADGQALLGYILTSGPETVRDADAAREWYRKSAEAGCPQGALGYALALGQMPGGEEHNKEIVAWLRKAGEADLPTALFLLGEITDRGFCVPRDRAVATELYRRAAEKGHRSGQARYGLALMEGAGIAANPVDGETWLRKAALAGDPEAAALVGDLYARGGPLPPNYAEAAMWFRRASEAGHKGASRALGMLYLTGAGVPRDEREAAHWFRLSADAGDARAQIDLANLVRQGAAGEDDARHAREWFEQAA
ncbi:MAG: SEL1-like repeat protein, partial [Acetobacteraceae bacterium]